MKRASSGDDMAKKLNITLVGGGNSTHVLAALASNAGHSVSILTRRVDAWAADRVITLQNSDPGWLGGTPTVSGTVAAISSDAAALVSGADMIVLAGLPVHLYREMLQQICPHITRHGVMIGSVCAYGGFSWLVKEAMGKERAGSVCVFGCQSIPWTCGLVEYGKVGAVFGTKRHLHLAFDNIETCAVSNDALSLVGKVLRIDEIERTDFLTCTLWPNNPLFHPTVLWGIFAEWDMQTPYKVEDVPARIYADVTRRSAETIEAMDAEMQLIVAAVRAKQPDNPYLHMARPLKECLMYHYAELISDPTDMYSILRSNSAYAKHRITYKTVGEGLVIPDVGHKFFTTDLPYGLCIYKDLALTLGVAVPTIDKLILWNQKMVSKEFMTASGKLDGKHVAEAVLPSMYESF